MILYRRIVTVGTEKKDKNLVEFISKEYFKVKKWKKSPKGFDVYDDNGYVSISSTKQNHGYTKYVGNLEDLYKNIEGMDENQYTSYYNKATYTIKIGSLYKIDEKEINLDNGVCHSGGLHAACVSYDYGGYGDTPVVVLVNPAKAITVPVSDRGKLRTTEMFIACVNDKPRGVHFDEDGLSAFDDEYHDLTIKELEQAVAGKTLDPITVKGKKPAITIDNVQLIKNALKERIQLVS